MKLTIEQTSIYSYRGLYMMRTSQDRLTVKLLTDSPTGGNVLGIL